MGENFKDLDVSQVVYLLLYLFIVIMGLRRMPSAVRRKAEPPRCKTCKTPVGPDAAPQGPWGGWVCTACGGAVDPVSKPEPRTGLRGWMDQYPWAVYGAIWGLVVWGLLAGRDLWLHEPTPDLQTLPLTIVGAFGVGWLLTLMQRRR
ncbi:hypothetical protein [Caulobacter soli]|uniref:hypothetical protein n=1 Tax=Caulobacter soli TaxID=2708539 RepID=UPI0013EA5F84|nr:hypothetical protein [Caulobacter soli]